MKKFLVLMICSMMVISCSKEIGIITAGSAITDGPITAITLLVLGTAVGIGAGAVAHKLDGSKQSLFGYAVDGLTNRLPRTEPYENSRELIGSDFSKLNQITERVYGKDPTLALAIYRIENNIPEPFVSVDELRLLVDSWEKTGRKDKFTKYCQNLKKKAKELEKQRITQKPKELGPKQSF